MKIVSFALSFVAVASVPFSVSAPFAQSRTRQLGATRAAPAPSSEYAVEEAAPLASARARAGSPRGGVLLGFGPGVPAGQRYAIERAAGAEGARHLGRVDTYGAHYPLRIHPIIEQARLTGIGEIGRGNFFGYSLARSSDGNAAVIGGPGNLTALSPATVATIGSEPV